jgi:hypothetical protein
VCFIVKPDAGCQGKGIFIAKSLQELKYKVDLNLQRQQKEFDEFIRAEECADTQQRYSDTLTEIPQQNYHKDTSYVVQKYLKHPALWHGHKFDFRIYVLLLSVIDQPTIFLFNDGLVRLASEPYQKTNINDVYSHLTNYSLNKKNDNFDDTQHKLKLSDCLSGTLTQKPAKPGRSSVSRSGKDLWQDIEAMVVKTILTA